MQLTKLHDTLFVSIKALPNCVDYPCHIQGTYKHIPRSQSFGLERSGKLSILSRDEWNMIAKAPFPPQDMKPCLECGTTMIMDMGLVDMSVPVHMCPDCGYYPEQSIDDQWYDLVTGKQ